MFHFPRTPLRPIAGVVVTLLLAAAGAAPAQVFYSHGEPTADEQFTLELLNTARANPAATGERLASTTDPVMVFNYREYGVDRAFLRAQFASYAPRPPLAFHPALIVAARRHTADMVANNFSGHTGSDGTTYGQRARAAGYPHSQVAENAAGSGAYDNIEQLVDGAYLVDWGTSSLGHRVNILDLRANYPGATEVGIGCGARFTDTQDFGYYLSAAPRYLTGVAYRDLNDNGRYDQGEGVPGVAVLVAGNGRYTVTGQSGGYSLPLDRTGAFNARAEGGILPAPIHRNASTAGENVKWDLVWAADGTPPIGDAPPAASGNVISVVGDAGRGGFVVSRRGDLSSALSVAYHVGGAAIGGRDYEALPGTVVIPAGTAEVLIPIRVINARSKVKVFLDPGAYGIGKSQSKLVLTEL